MSLALPRAKNTTVLLVTDGTIVRTSISAGIQTKIKKNLVAIIIQMHLTPEPVPLPRKAEQIMVCAPSFVFQALL